MHMTTRKLLVMLNLALLITNHNFAHSLNTNKGDYDLRRCEKVIERDYNLPITSAEKKCIRKIIQKLSQDLFVSVIGSKSELERNGDLIKHIHPFRFLEYTLNDEELKTGMLAIRQRGGLLWSGFIDGITNSLGEESRKNNLMIFLNDFADAIKLDVKKISPPLKDGKWDNFVNLLLDSLPRKNDPNRYNM